MGRVGACVSLYCPPRTTHIYQNVERFVCRVCGLLSTVIDLGWRPKPGLRKVKNHYNIDTHTVIWQVAETRSVGIYIWLATKWTIRQCSLITTTTTIFTLHSILKRSRAIRTLRYCIYLRYVANSLIYPWCSEEYSGQAVSVIITSSTRQGCISN